MKNFFITIYIILVVSLLFIDYGLFPITDELLEDQTLKFTREMAKGTFSLVSEKLEGLDDEKQKYELAKLQPKFGYPIELYNIDGYTIDPEDIEDFRNGLIIDDDEQSYVLIQRLGNTEKLLTMGGPFPHRGLNSYGKFFLLSLCVLFLLIPAFVWSYFLNKDMKRIEESGAKFTMGDHSARALVSRISSLFQIASMFNTMAEKSQNLLESQKDLTNSVSHEIRTPLSRIQFSLEMVTDANRILPQEKKYIDRISKDVDEIETLVDEMLTYAKFEVEPENHKNFSKYEMTSWLETIVDEERNTLKNIDLFFKKEPGANRLIAKFEPVYLGRALQNLIRNGARYAQLRVDVIIELCQDKIRIYVDDDGTGIPEKSRAKIFEPFFRIDDSRARESGGYGLGLAIVKRIIVWHGGSINISQSPLKGARFTISLPIIEAPYQTIKISNT
jgi:signal transduction histidine kinase